MKRRVKCCILDLIVKMVIKTMPEGIRTLDIRKTSVFSISKTNDDIFRSFWVTVRWSSDPIRSPQINLDKLNLVCDWVRDLVIGEV